MALCVCVCVCNAWLCRARFAPLCWYCARCLSSEGHCQSGHTPTHSIPPQHDVCPLGHTGRQPKIQNNSTVSELYFGWRLIKKQNTSWDVIIWKRSWKLEMKAVNLEVFFFFPVFPKSIWTILNWWCHYFDGRSNAANLYFKENCILSEGHLNQKIKLFHLDPQFDRLK